MNKLIAIKPCFNNSILAPDGDISSYDSLQEPLKESSSLKSTAYNIAKLAPKFFLSGVGWCIGFALGGNLGAGLGDAVGAFIGSILSFLIIELVIGKRFNLDSSLNNQKFTALATERLMEALILSAGCFTGGFVSNTAFTKVAKLIRDSGVFANLGKALITGSINATAFLLGTTVARISFRDLSKENLIEDLKSALWETFPAETAFVATALPLLGSKWLMGKSLEILKSGTASFIGGELGIISQKVFDKRLEEWYREHSLDKPQKAI